MKQTVWFHAYRMSEHPTQACKVCFRLSWGLCFTHKWCTQCYVSLCYSVGYEKLHCQSSLSLSVHLARFLYMQNLSLPSPWIHPHVGQLLNNEKLFSKWHLLFITDCGGVCGGKFLRILWGNVSYQPGRFLISSLLLLFQIINGKNNRNRKYLKSPTLGLFHFPTCYFLFLART